MRTRDALSPLRASLRSATACLGEHFCQLRLNFFDRNTANTNRQVQQTIDTMAEKKRKRNEDGAERPSKKTAVAPQGNVKVELLQEEALGPLLGMLRYALRRQHRLIEQQLRHRVSRYRRA